MPTEDIHPNAASSDTEERLRAILNTVVDGIITIDHAGIIESFNPAAERMFGYAADECIGEPVTMLMPEPYAGAHDGYIARYLQTGEAKIIGIGRDVRGKRKGGTIFPMRLAVSEIEHLGIFVGIVRDLTDDKRAEEQLRQADRLASIGSLAAGLGHDMNNVLLPVRGWLDVLDAGDLPHRLRQHVRTIRDSVSYLQQLSDGLHLLALDPSAEGASGGSTEIAAWWGQVGPLLQRSLPRHVKLIAALDETLPAIAVAPHRLTQAMLNLLVNAGAAVDEDGQVRVEAEATACGRRVCLCVADNGAGMSSDVRERALEPFFTTKERGLGTGLGLALVNGIVKSAGGRIEIDSAPRQGTAVVLEFPIAKEERAQQSDAETPARRAVVSIRDDRIGTLLGSMLESMNFEVAFQNGFDLGARLWITAPEDTTVDAVQRFLSEPGRQVVICSNEVATWERTGAKVISDLTDLEMVRDRLGRAISDGHVE